MCKLVEGLTGFTHGLEWKQHHEPKVKQVLHKAYEDETLSEALRKMNIEKKARVQAHDYRESWGENDKNFYWVLYHHSYAA